MFVHAGVSVKVQLKFDHLVSVHLKPNVHYILHNLVLHKCGPVHGCM